MEAENDHKIIEILYTDPCGNMVKRRILPRQILFRVISGHTREQWVLEARDIDAGVEESFALKDIQAWLPSELLAAPF